MQAVAERSKEDYLRARAADEAVSLGDVSCEYAGVAQDDGSYDLQAPIRQNSTIGFRWKVDFDGPQDTVAEVRCDNAGARGVPFPPSWHFAPHCRDFQTIADASAAQAAKLHGLADASCRVLGQPRRCPLTDEANGPAPGIAVELCLDGAAVEFLLCAHVYEDMWFCTRGLFVDDVFQSSDPFGVDSLVLKDVQRDARRQELEAQSEDIKPSLHPGQLKKLAAARPDRWDMVVAVAKWRAEVTKAELKSRPPDMEQACAAFERDPFRWHVHTSRRVHTQVVTLWSWFGGDQWCEFFQTNRVDNVLERGFPRPQHQNTPDETLWRNLCAIAEGETQQRKAPCAYLGLAVAGGKFEPDPSKWPTKLHPSSQGRTKATVHFEWVGVAIDGRAHTVAVSVNHALHNQRAPPQNPLANTSPSGLKFSPCFMETVAQNVHEEAHFKGIAFEGERASIVPQLPQGGVDIQDEPVYWTLPDGRCEHWSVRRMAEATDDLLAPQDSEEAYKAVAKEMNYDVLGAADEEALELFRVAPGTLVERLWEKIEWRCPSDETCSCWWIANAGEPDKTSAVKLVAKSLACLRLELHATRCATSIKLRQTWERRLEENGLAVDALFNNAQLWRHVCGPDPDTLLKPREGDLKAARLAAHRLRCMLIVHGPNAQDGLDVYAEEIFRAVGMLKQAGTPLSISPKDVPSASFPKDLP